MNSEKKYVVVFLQFEYKTDKQGLDELAFKWDIADISDIG